MASRVRQDRLLELVRINGFASLHNLANLLKVSESTVRRDLGFLEKEGSVKRTHGGVFYTGPSPNLGHFNQRQQSEHDRKVAIAELTASLINDGDTLLLDGGSTTYELAQRLVGRPMQIVTNSLPVATAFTSSEETDVVLIGGYVHSRTGVAIGPYSVSMIQQLNVQRAVISVAGITDRGIYNSNLLLVETEKAMMQAADEVTVVADSTKFNKSSLALLCELSMIDSIVVDDELDAEWINTLRLAGIDVQIAAIRTQIEPTS